MAPQVHEVHKVPRAPKGIWGPWGRRGPWGPLVALESGVNRGRWGHPVRWVSEDRLASRERPGCKVPWVPWVLSGRRAPKANKAEQVLRGCRAPWAPKAQMANRASMGPPGRWVNKGLEENLAQSDAQDPRESVAKRVPWVSPGQPVRSVLADRSVSPVHWGRKVNKVRKVPSGQPG